VTSESRKLSERLSESQIYRDYERAFCEATGLPLSLHPATDPGPSFKKCRFTNPFCLQLAETDHGCQICREMQERLAQEGSVPATTATCRAGLTDSAVPIKLGDKTVAYLCTGQIALKRPSRSKFHQLVEWLAEENPGEDFKTLEKKYFATRVLQPKQYEAMVKLLEVFAMHLSLAAERLATIEAQAEPPMVQRARRFIEEHQQEDISLSDAAHAVHASTFHFCKMFKKATGMTFTEYLSLMRVTKAKELLLNPNARVSEVAYEVGFNSLTHFNRTFRKLTGRSPTAYREQVQS
jgi:AraC-like DNA-binding protein/ligand-binding sensor protein